MPSTVYSKHDPAGAHTPWESVKPPVIDLEQALQVTEETPAPIEQPRESSGTVGGGLFTIPLLCLGIGLIACCVLIPAADENRHLVYERQKLQADLDEITQQVSVNDEFLKRVADDPTLSERLAQRQMKMVREGTSVLELKGESSKDMSPFELVTLPPPPELPPYRPIGGKHSDICRDPHSQLYLMGSGMLLLAAGLVLGSSGKDEKVTV